MNKKIVKRSVAALGVAGLLCCTAVAASTVTTKMIEANYMGIKLVVDGVAVTPKDANGNTVEPFASQGTTYLPVRAVADALGKEVTWDGDTATVYIGQVPGQEENWMKTLPPYQVNSRSAVYDGSEPTKSFSVGGVKHTSGVALQYFSTGYAIWNTDLKYSSMTFTVGSQDENEMDTTMNIYVDGTLVETHELNWDNPPQTFTVPLNRAASVKIEMVGSNSNTSYYGLYDISFQA